MLLIIKHNYVQCKLYSQPLKNEANFDDGTVNFVYSMVSILKANNALLCRYELVT